MRNYIISYFELLSFYFKNFPNTLTPKVLKEGALSMDEIVYTHSKSILLVTFLED